MISRIEERRVAGRVPIEGQAGNAEKLKCGMMKTADGRRVSLLGRSDGNAARILVIEDNRSDVYLLDRALRKQDFPFELIHLVNGNEALAFIGQQGAYASTEIPDLILVDLNLSKHTGADILRQIRSSRRLKAVPVCVWSSSRSPRDEALLKSLGISQFITKPSGLDQFMEIGAVLKALLVSSGSR